VLKFGPLIARRLRQCRPRPSDRWHLDEMVRVAGKRMYLWRAVYHEGEIFSAGETAARPSGSCASCYESKASRVSGVPGAPFGVPLER